MLAKRILSKSYVIFFQSEKRSNMTPEDHQNKQENLKKRNQKSWKSVHVEVLHTNNRRKFTAKLSRKKASTRTTTLLVRKDRHDKRRGKSTIPEKLSENVSINGQLVCRIIRENYKKKKGSYH